MHIAILVTNTDRSDFSRRNPRDPELFENLIAIHRQAWRFSAFDVTEGNFPQDPSRFDGIIVSGSPASVNDGAAWLDRLSDMIVEIVEQRIPLFGACFGHQAIAKAFGGRIGYNPAGWQLGFTSTQFAAHRPWLGDAGEIGLYAAHKEQVLDLPEQATILGVSEQCPVGAFAIGDHVFTTQHHPEMTPGFIAALIDEMANDIGPELTKAARESLKCQAENARFAQWIVAFFEHAARLRMPARRSEQA